MRPRSAAERRRRLENIELEWHPVRVLLVVADPSLRSVCRQTLLSAEFSVVEPPSDEVAVELADTITPDLVIVDVRVPGFRGWDLIRRLRELWWADELPIVALVEELGESEVWYARRMRATVLLKVPTEMECLLQTVQRALEGGSG